MLKWHSTKTYKHLISEHATIQTLTISISPAENTEKPWIPSYFDYNESTNN